VYDEFAAGGMATVHYARLIGAQGFRRTVAAKRLLPHLTRDRDFALMLVDEARLAARVRHPNVVSTLDVVQTDGELLLVMDYIHGESLAKLSRAADQRGERIPLNIALAIVIDALHGLHAAHEAKDERGLPLDLVHRDVSPQNVLVGLDGITRIADFGVAKAAGRAHTTRDGAVKGKLAYMAPEQLSSGTVARTTDVFAASVVLWELLVNERLFAGQNHAETVFKVMSAPIPAPRTRETSLSPELDKIVMRGLSREPALRFASARDMALALEDHAPSVRPSEIAAWVERIAGERLAQRAEVLSAIEHEEDVDTDAPTKPLDGEGHASADDSAYQREPLDGETGKRRRETHGASAFAVPGSAARAPAPLPAAHAPSASVSSQHLSAARSSSPAHGTGERDQTPHEPRVAAVAVRSHQTRIVLVAIAALVAITWFASSQLGRPYARSPDPIAPPPAPTSAPAQATTAPSPAFATPAARALAPSTAVPLATPLANDTVPPIAAPLRGSVDAAVELASPQGKRRARPARKNNLPGCDPPYSIDATGKVLFKVQCM